MIKLSESNIESIKTSYETFVWLVQPDKIPQNRYEKKCLPLKKNGHKYKKIDFYNKMANKYGVHWKSIERIIRQ